MSAALINYHREGTGSPLVLVHGIGATWQCWRPVIPGLAARHDVIAIDLPGFGGSVSLGISEPSLEHFAASILALLDHLGIQEFHVVGNSLGGAVAAELCNSGRVLTYTGISAAGHTYGPGPSSLGRSCAPRTTGRGPSVRGAPHAAAPAGAGARAVADARAPLEGVARVRPGSHRRLRDRRRVPTDPRPRHPRCGPPGPALDWARADAVGHAI